MLEDKEASDDDDHNDDSNTNQEDDYFANSMDEINVVMATPRHGKRGSLTRSSSGRKGSKKKGLLPARLLKRSSSAKGGSFSGSLENVDEEGVDSSSEYEPERRASHPAAQSILHSTAVGNKQRSFRESLNSMRIFNSQSTLSSTTSSVSLTIADSVNIMDFGISERGFDYEAFADSSSMKSLGSATLESRSRDGMSSRDSSSRCLSDSDGFVGWGTGSSKNIPIELNPQQQKKGDKKKKGKKSGRPAPRRDSTTRLDSCSSNLSSQVDSEGVLMWQSNSTLGDSSSRAMSVSARKAEEKKTDEGKKETEEADALPPIKPSSSSGNVLSRRIRRVSQSFTSSFTSGAKQRNMSWDINNNNSGLLDESDRSNGQTYRIQRRSTSDIPRRPSSLILPPIFGGRRRNTQDDRIDSSEEYNIRPIRQLNREDSGVVDILELRRELCEAGGSGGDHQDANNNKKGLLKNVIFS